MDVSELLFSFRLVSWVRRADRRAPSICTVHLVDVITIEKTDEHFRLIYDVKGRFCGHRIRPEEAKVSILSSTKGQVNVCLSFQYKLCKVKSVRMGPKKVPYIITHDARTIRYPNPHIKANDTVQIDIATGKILEHIKFDTGERRKTSCVE